MFAACHTHMFYLEARIFSVYSRQRRHGETFSSRGSNYQAVKVGNAALDRYFYLEARIISL